MNRCRRRRLGVVLVLVVLAVTLSAPAAGGAGTDTDVTNRTANATVGGTESVSATGSAPTAGASGATIELTQQLRLVPDRNGVYAVGHRYRMPDQAALLAVTLPEDATVTGERGFVRTDARTYEWDGTTEQPRIDYRLAANRSTDRDGPIAAPGRLLYTDVGEWALVTQPRVSHRWGWRGAEQVGLDATMTAENGATGDTLAFLGDHEVYTHEAHGQRFRLVVPDRATLREDPNDVFASLADASDRLRVGARDDSVFLVAAPTGQVDWGVRGLQTGDSDIWVRDLEQLDVADNVWLHEYVHSRQAYAASPDLRWSTEGTATYYAALFTLEQNRITFGQFRDTLATGQRASFGDAVLTDPTTWANNANYPVGALVAGELDRRLRLAGEGRPFQEVLRRMNAQDRVVDAADFERHLRAVGTDSVAEAGRRYTRTSDRPAVWTEAQHNDLFAPTPARITYTFADVPVGVSGEYRDRELDGTEALVLVPGERLTLAVNVTNFGGTTGSYDVPLRVDDTSESTRSGRLAPGESETLRFEHAFETPGTHVVSVGAAQVSVRVRDPAAATVSALAADRTEVPAGDSVTLSATVTNDAPYPGAVTVPLTRDGGTVGTEQVRLDAMAERTVSFESTLETPGVYVFGVGNASVEPVVVRVTEPAAGEMGDDGEAPAGEDGGTPSPNERTDDTPDGDGTGFGAVVAVLAVVVVACHRRRRSI